jgi:putative ABC transport system permease protein
MAALQWGGLCVAAEGVTIAFRPSLPLALTGLAVSLCVGIIAGIAPGWQAAQTKIVTALRHA